MVVSRAGVSTAPNRGFCGTWYSPQRAASIYGDIRFQSDRRLLLESNLGRNARKDGQAEPAFSFLFAQETGNAASGVPHGSDLPYGALIGKESPLERPCGTFVNGRWLKRLKGSPKRAPFSIYSDGLEARIRDRGLYEACMDRLCDFVESERARA